MRHSLNPDGRSLAESAERQAGWKLLSGLSFDPGLIDRLNISAEWFHDPQQQTVFLALAAFHHARPEGRMVTAEELFRFMAGHRELAHLLRRDEEGGNLCTVSLSELSVAFENAYYDSDGVPSHVTVLQNSAFQRQVVEALATVTESVAEPDQLVEKLRNVTEELAASPAVGSQPPIVDLTNLPVDCEEDAPRPLGPAAFWGPAAEFVRKVLPQTEADPAALLFHFLAYAAAMFGRNRCFVVDAAEHYPTLFAAFVGASSKGRKGTALRNCEWLFRLVDGPQGTFLQQNVVSGLSSGEGLIHQVRDPTLKDGAVIEEGCTDKRRLVVESEFGGTLRMGRREGNSLSSVLRDAWDRDHLRVLTRHSPLVSTAPHICIIGHIVREELRRMMGGSDHFNGFANRFLWVFTQRSKLLPNGGNLREEDFRELVDSVKAAIEFARIPGRMIRSPEAARHWEDAYRALAIDRPGLVGAVTNRAEAQVLRLSMIYALLDCSDVIEVDHLQAALECWRYCEDSARFAFGESTGDKTADEIRALLAAAGETGMTRTSLSTAFGRNRSAAEIRQSLGTLQRAGLAHSRRSPSRGRPVETWFVGPATDEFREENEMSRPDAGLNSLISSNSSAPESLPQTPGYVPRKPLGRVFGEDEVDRINQAFSGSNSC